MRGDQHLSSSVGLQSEDLTPSKNGRYRVIAMDFGIKYNILRQLTKHGCEVQVVPAKTTAEEILAAEPDGVFLSNGPGDPMPLDYATKTIQELMGKKPIFGICLGHQLLGACTRWKNL